MASEINISNLQVFSDSDLLACYRYAIANAAFRQTYTVNGRTFTAPDIDKCMKMVAWLEQRIQDDANLLSGVGGNVSVVQFNPPQ